MPPVSKSFPFSVGKATTLFTKHTKSIVWGMQTRAVQGMLDFDYICSRAEPSVAAMVYPFTYVCCACPLYLVSALSVMPVCCNITVKTSESTVLFLLFLICVSCWLPSSGDHKQKFYWGHKEILLPVYKNMSDAMKKHPDVDVLINFASLRSAFDSTIETMQYPQVPSCSICGL